MGSNDSLGRTVLIAVVAGLLFAGFLALTPRLTASQQSEVGPAAVEPDASAVSISEPAIPVTQGAFDGFDEPIVEETADEGDWVDEPSDDEWAQPETECSDAVECECICDTRDGWDQDGWNKDGWDPASDGTSGDEWDEDWDWNDGDTPAVLDGSLDVKMELLGPGTGKESVILTEGDLARFEFIVENDTDDDLWGIFLYLESSGPVDCPTDHLEGGEVMYCSAQDRVWAGDQTAFAWATAWTDTHEVGAEVEIDYWVAD